MTTWPISALLRDYEFLQDCPTIDDLQSGGGFSGARLWRAAGSPAYCIKQYPSSIGSTRLTWIQQVIEAVSHAGVPALSIACRTTRGDHHVTISNRLFEVTPWMPGVADYSRNPTPERLVAAMEWLAMFHRAVDSPTSHSLLHSTIDDGGSPPSLLRRLERGRQLLAGRLGQIEAAVRERAEPWSHDAASHLIPYFRRVGTGMVRDLESALAKPCPQQVCLRDIWHDHVLFEGNSVSGVIDYDAVRVDSPAADIARLLGSLVGDDSQAWTAGLAAYDALRPLSRHERELVRIIDQANVGMAGLQWLEWLYIDRRRFESSSNVAKRMSGWVERVKAVVR